MSAASLPSLDRALLAGLGGAGRTSPMLPPPQLLDLPEKAVQFGTGAFLRGFVDPFIDEANRQGLFRGRVVMIGSTGSGRDQVLNDQDGLFTLAVRGVAGGSIRDEQRVIASVSRAVSAHDDWDAVLACARNPELELVFSNTTEVGITLDEGDEFSLRPPLSFPGKLTRFLFERAQTFGFDTTRGVVVIPCELIENNGQRLREIVLALAGRWQLGSGFTDWIDAAVPFCNTLVDRIVPGTPRGEEMAAFEASLGYRDELLTTCEVYRLFAIEADEPVRKRLTFAGADAGIVITDDIAPFRELKVRLLNGAHTIMVPAALLAGCETVHEAMQHAQIARFVRRVMLDEIVPGLATPGAEAFARAVLDRFANPFIRHALADITLQGTMKMRVRVVPSILRFAELTGRAPSSIAFGFAAHLLFMRGDVHEQRRAAGLNMPVDEQSEPFRRAWADAQTHAGDGRRRLVDEVCSDASLWGADLTAVTGFAAAVRTHLERMVRDGAGAALKAHLEAAA